MTQYRSSALGEDVGLQTTVSRGHVVILRAKNIIE